MTTLVGKAIALDVQKTYTIDDVKVYIKAGYGYPVQWQCLKSTGNHLMMDTSCQTTTSKSNRCCAQHLGYGVVMSDSQDAMVELTQVAKASAMRCRLCKYANVVEAWRY